MKLPADRPLRVAVVADTHANPHPGLRGHLERLEPDWILHAGDIGSKQVTDQLDEIAPVIAVRGNIDPPGHWPDHVAIRFESDGRLLLKAVLSHIVLQGPRLLREAAELAKREAAQLIVCGHSHVPFIGSDRGIAVFNPGSAGPRRFTLPILYGVLTLSPERLNLEHFDCASGTAWSPPG